MCQADTRYDGRLCLLVGDGRRTHQSANYPAILVTGVTAADVINAIGLSDWKDKPVIVTDFQNLAERRSCTCRNPRMPSLALMVVVARRASQHHIGPFVSVSP